MQRKVMNGFVATVLVVLAMSGEAAAFTPVPIPMPRTGSAAVAQVGHAQAHALARSTRD